jgi:hypothetical protein
MKGRTIACLGDSQIRDLCAGLGFFLAGQTVENASDAKYDKNAKGRLERVSYCHEYVGEGLGGYEELLKPIKEMRDNNKLKLEL